ncbi:MAG: 50S ribosomal protein L19 [Candidatus Shikimatogenerans bostrichidophilus]|nr:MAG: 50S ribosomal protein L19 [Candidatus Shikimatogenerans bostrichidophilus]
MKMEEKKIINILEEKYIKKNNNINYNFNVGDNITIYYYNNFSIKNKKNIIRNQVFTGYVISKRGNNKLNKTFIIRKIINNIGVEITFFLYSPYINNIIINKKGKVKKSKIYYIRKLFSKKIKIKEKK